MPLSLVANAAPLAQHPLATPARQTIRVLDGYECASKKACIQECLGKGNNTKASCETFCSQCKGD